MKRIILYPSKSLSFEEIVGLDTRLHTHIHCCILIPTKSSERKIPGSRSGDIYSIANFIEDWKTSCIVFPNIHIQYSDICKILFEDKVMTFLYDWHF